MRFKDIHFKKLMNNIAFILLSIVVILISSNLFSQVAEEWVTRYNCPGNYDDEAFAIAVDSLGNIYVTGYSLVLERGDNYATIKYNNEGAEQWVARYNGPGNSIDEAYDIAVDSSGNVYVTGVSWGSGTNYDYATIKYNSEGAEQWVARYNGPGNKSDYANAIALDSSGNVYVTGESNGSGTSIDYATIKYNSSGVEQWVARYNGPGNGGDYAYAIVVDSSGNVYVTGSSYGSVTNYSDYATIKYNSSGVQQWVARYNGPGNDGDWAEAIAVDSSGNVYVTGDSWGGSVTAGDYATIKYNSSGIQQWVSRYNGPGNYQDRAYAIALDSSGNVYVTGLSYDSVTAADYATIKYNNSGVEQWVARYNGLGSANDEAYAIALDSSGNVYVTGRSACSGIGPNYDYVTIKYNSAGVQQWLARYYGPGDDYDQASDIAIDSSGNVYVTGESNLNGQLDFVTIKYSQNILVNVNEYNWMNY